MDDKKYLKDQLRKWKRKMNLAEILDSGILCAAAGGIAGILCELISLFRPFYYANLAAALCFGAGFLAGGCYAVYRRADMRQAASRLDSFGLKERMLTACENMDQEDEFAKLQRQDAVRHYDRVREQIRIPLLSDKRHLLALLVSAAVAAGMCFIPSPVREQARLRHQVQEQAEEQKEALEKLVDALEGVDTESLTGEQREALQELLDTMELSREELAASDSWESLSAAAQKLDYKYSQAARSLKELAGQMENPEEAGIAAAEAFAKAAADQSGQQMASGGSPSAGAGGENSENNGAGHSGDGENGENGSGENGQGQSGSGSEGDGSGEGQSRDGEKGSGEGGGRSNGNGQGQSNGQSGGNGQGQGEGQGQGDGSGGGNGNGQGLGSSDAAHDYVSIPNAAADDPSLTGNKNGDQDSDYYRQQNGLAWEGDHVDYSSVIGEYTDSAYEGIANGRYPSGMESVIRDYFENLNR